MNLKNLLSQATSLFGFEQSPSEKKVGSLSNDDIKALFLDSFANSIEYRSMKGNRMLYDLSYTMLMHPKDYAEKELDLPIITKVAVNSFYDTIEKNKDKYPDFMPTGNNWSFQYSPIERFEDREIALGEVLIIGTPVALKREKIGKFLTVSIVSNNSKYDRYDINPEAIIGLDIQARGMFWVKINPDLTRLVKPPKSAAECYANIKYIMAGSEWTYPMIETEIIISLKNESMANATNVLAIDVQGQGLKNNHARIRYDEANDRFEIVANAEGVLVNEKAIPLYPYAESLPDKASIMLGWYNVKFERVIVK